MSEQTKHTLNPNKWIDLHSDYMFNYTISRVSNQDVAKDLVQETFLASLKAMGNFKGQASERTWLISILKRKIVDHYRKSNSIKGKSEVRMSFYEDGENNGKWIEERAPSPWDDADASIENEELKSALDYCIDNLPEKYKSVFILKTIKNYETESICNDLGISSSNLWVIIHRARVQLRECLEGNWFNK